MQELTYKGITSHSIDILLKHAAIKGDDKLSSYLGKHFDELVQLYTPIIKDTLDAYFEAPLSEYGPFPHNNGRPACPTEGAEPGASGAAKQSNATQVFPT